MSRQERTIRSFLIIRFEKSNADAVDTENYYQSLRVTNRINIKH
jgi:hypothetical protein